MVMLEEQTQAAPPAGTGQQKERAVQRMFSSIARYYDLNNTLLSLGLHHSWKRHAVGFLSPNDFRVLDVGAGTADLALLTAERLGNGARIVAADLNGPMLAIGSAKVQKAGLQRQVVCVQANAERLCVSDSVFDAVTTGFCMPNVSRRLQSQATPEGPPAYPLPAADPARPALKGHSRDRRERSPRPGLFLLARHPDRLAARRGRLARAGLQLLLFAEPFQETRRVAFRPEIALPVLRRHPD